MGSGAGRLQACVLALARGELRDEAQLPLVLRRCASSALRRSTGGRCPHQDEVDDLVHDFVVRVMERRALKTLGSLEALDDAQVVVWVRTTMKRLVVEQRPWWATQRALREVVRKAVEAGLPAATGLPLTLEASGRFDRAHVGQACAELRVGRPDADATTLTSLLMDAYDLVHVVDDRVEVPQVSGDERGAEDLVARQQVSDEVVDAFLGEAGEGGRSLLVGRERGLASMARQAGVALSTVHARWQRVVRALRTAATKCEADREALSLALEQLAAQPAPFSEAHGPA